MDLLPLDVYHLFCYLCFFFPVLIYGHVALRTISMGPRQKGDWVGRGFVVFTKCFVLVVGRFCNVGCFELMTSRCLLLKSEIWLRTQLTFVPFAG